MALLNSSKCLLLVRAGAGDCLLANANLRLTHCFIDLADISSTDKYTTLDILFKEAVLTCFGIDLG